MATVPASIKAAFAEANRLWPERSRASDGTVGDARHQASRSDHNPDSRGVIHAFDLTNDPGHGVDCHALVGMLVGRKDPRVEYVIWSRTIWRSYDKPRLAAWTPEPYRGSNPHTRHMHVSIRHTASAENSGGSWWSDTPTRTPPPPVVYRWSDEGAPMLTQRITVELDSEGRGNERSGIPAEKFVAVHAEAGVVPNTDGWYPGDPGRPKPEAWHTIEDGQITVIVIGGHPSFPVGVWLTTRD